MRSVYLSLLLMLIPGYSLAFKVDHWPDGKFGQGDLRGLAAPETAIGASVCGSLVPMLTLGLPTTATAARRSATSAHSAC